MERFASDERLNPTHVSMYLALFQYWNLARFKNPVSISRAEIMRLSKIGSKVTYHRCIKDLHNWSYLEYAPSHNPFQGSKVYMFKFCTSSEQAKNHSSSKNGQVEGQEVVPFKTDINLSNKKGRKPPPTFDEVKEFFTDQFPEPFGSEIEIEARKFFNHYTSVGWKIGKSEMQNWSAAAENWIIRTSEHQLAQNKDNLSIETDKSYDQPL